MHVRKEGLNPKVVQDLRRQFRIRSAQKDKTLHPRDLAEKTRKGQSKAKRKTKHSATGIGPLSSSSTSTKSDGSGSWGGMGSAKGSKPCNDDDPPTEFEKVENAKPAHFAREYHKMEVTAGGSSPASPTPQMQPLSTGASQSVKKERHKQRDKKRRSYRRRSRREVHAPVSSSSTTSTTSIIERRNPDESQSVAKKSRSSVRKRRENSSSGVNGIKLDREKERQSRKRQNELLRSPAKEVNREREKLPPASDATPTAVPHQPENLKSFDEETETSGRSVAQPRGFLVPANDANFKLQPVTNEKTKVSEVEEVTAVDDDVHEPADILKQDDHTILDCDKFGNANFSLVDSAGKVIDYCHEKDFFQEIADPAEYAIFNDFFCGKSKFDDKMLTLIESMLEQVLDSRKLAEVPTLTKPLKLLGKDRAEGRNNLLDALISKKATVGDTLTTPTPTNGTSSTSTQSQSSLDGSVYSPATEKKSPTQHQQQQLPPDVSKDKEESSEQRSG